MQQQIASDPVYYSWKYGLDPQHIRPQPGIPFDKKKFCGCSRPYYVRQGMVFDDKDAAETLRPLGGILERFSCIKEVRQRYGNDLTERFTEYLTHQDEQGLAVHEVYTDGSCANNGLPGAIAGCGVYFGKNNPGNRSVRVNEHRNVPTSQVAELLAISVALEVISKVQRRVRKWVIYTDSDYALKCLTVWYDAWMRNGWVNARGQPVANQSVIKHVRAQLRLSTNVSLEKVTAHSDCEGNNFADRLAKQACLSTN